MARCGDDTKGDLAVGGGRHGIESPINHPHRESNREHKHHVPPEGRLTRSFHPKSVATATALKRGRRWLARTFGLSRRLYDMPNSAAEAQTPVEIGKTNILDQRRRIERQRGLIARLESDGSPDSVAEAVRILGEMEQALAQMEAHHAAAQEQPLEDSVDEPSLAKVEPLR